MSNEPEKDLAADFTKQQASPAKPHALLEVAVGPVLPTHPPQSVTAQPTLALCPPKLPFQTYHPANSLGNRVAGSQQATQQRWMQGFQKPKSAFVCGVFCLFPCLFLLNNLFILRGSAFWKG